MTEPPFTITIDRSRWRITTVLRGFWTQDVFAAYATELMAKAGRTGWPESRHTVLSDVGAFAIQSQAVFSMFVRLIEDDPHKPRRLALVGGNGLARMQFHRVLHGDDMKLFADLAEAERWLDETVPWHATPVEGCGTTV